MKISALDLLLLSILISCSCVIGVWMLVIK